MNESYYLSFLPYGRQTILPEDIEAVIQVLQSDWLTQGPAIERFEQAMAEYCQGSDSSPLYAVAVSSATAGLHLACRALDLGPGKRLWTSPNTFVASATCGLLCGATVDFVDIDPQTYNLSISALKHKLEMAQKTGTLPDVLVPVHFAGQSAEMQAIGELSQQYGFKVIEDAAHAVGASYQGQPVGSCLYSDMTVFSFHPVKIITTGEGGMVLTRNPDLANRLRRLRSHGITRNPAEFVGLQTGQIPNPWAYQQVEMGLNYRMTDLQAALGASQLQHLDGFLARRRELADRYNTLLADFPLTLPTQLSKTCSSWHLYVIRLRRDLLDPEITRRSVYEAMHAQGIGVQVHYIPVPSQPLFTGLGFTMDAYPAMQAYDQEALTLPLHPGLSDADQDRVVQALRESLIS